MNKRLLKKLAASTALVCAVVGFGLFTSCKKDPPADDTQEEQVVLTLNKNVLQLATYETFLLKTNVPKDSVRWNSSNESVVRVEEGLVTACGVGEATITAKSESGETSCLIYVVNNSLVPVIKSDLDYENNLFLHSKYTLDFNTIIFDGKEYISEFTYESSDPSVVSVSEKGELTAESLGSAFITAKSNWRGGVISSSYKYTVIENEAIINISNRNITIYSADIGNFSTAGKIEALLIKDGTIVSGSLNYESADDSIVAVSSNGELVAKTPGKTEITVSGKSGDTVFVEQTVNVYVEIPVVQSAEVIRLNKTTDKVALSSQKVFDDESMDLTRIVRKDTQNELEYSDGKIDLAGLKYGYYNFIYYTGVGKYGVEMSTYVAPPTGTLLIASDEYGAEQIVGGTGSRVFDSSVAWEGENGSLRLINGKSSWITRIAFEAEDIKNYEYLYFRIFAGDEEGGYLYGNGDKTTSKKLTYGWNTIVIKSTEFEGWYKSTDKRIVMGYTNEPQNNVPGNSVDDAWISDIYGVSKAALEELIDSLGDTLTDKDSQRVNVILDGFALLTDKNVKGKDAFIEKLKKFDGIGGADSNQLVSSDTRVGVLQLTTNATLSRDESFAYKNEKSSLKIYNANTSWCTDFSFKIDDIEKYGKISFSIYVENEYGGLIYDQNNTSGVVIEVEQGWNEIAITKDMFSRYYNSETKTFTMNYTSFNADHSNQGSYWKSIWLSVIYAEAV